MPRLSKLRSVFNVRGNINRREGNRPHVFADPTRNILVVIFGEFCGTFMFLLLSYIGTQAALDANDPGNPGGPLLPFSLIYVAASFGSALAVNVWIFYRVTGGMFNPAVTLALMLVGAVSPLRALLIFPTQLVAAIAAAAVVDGLLPGPLGVANKLANGTSITQGLFLEMFLTAQLVLTVYFLAVEKHRSTYLAPIGIGLSVFIAHVCGTNFDGTSINPARSFGPAVITGFTGYQWIFWLGPFMGTGLAFITYSTLKWLEYETANPGQDADDVERANRDARLPTDADVRAAHHGKKYYNGGHSRDDSRNDSVMNGQYDTQRDDRGMDGQRMDGQRMDGQRMDGQRMDEQGGRSV